MYILNPLVNHQISSSSLGFASYVWNILLNKNSEFSGHLPEILGNAGMRPVVLPRRRGTHRLFAVHLQWPWRGQRAFCAWGSDPWMEWSHGKNGDEPVAKL